MQATELPRRLEHPVTTNTMVSVAVADCRGVLRPPVGASWARAGGGYSRRRYRWAGRFTRGGPHI